MINNKKILFISPHSDDAEFSSGGTIYRCIQSNNDVHYVALSDCSSSLVGSGLPSDTIYKETLKALDTLGVKRNNIQINSFPQTLYKQEARAIFEVFQKIRDTVKPDVVFMPSLEDTHEDHSVVAKQALIAFRRSTSIICYEQPWNNLVFRHNFFVELGEKELAIKIKMLRTFKSQFIMKRPYFDVEFITGLARVRGMQFNTKYAEAFEVIKLFSPAGLRMKNKLYTFADIQDVIGPDAEVIGNRESITFSDVAPLGNAGSKSLVYAVSAKKNIRELISQTTASIIIVDKKELVREHKTKCFIITPSAKRVYARIIKKLFTRKLTYGIHPTAIVHKDARVHPDTYIGPHSYIGNSEIGKGTIIYGNTHIYDDVIIGSNVIIHAGVVLGADGFGYVKSEDGLYEQFPQIGKVVIEDNVEIGANSCVDKAALGVTHIGAGTKIDNLVHIGHNVVIGKNTVITAHSIVSGSAEIGDNVYMAPHVSVRDSVKIGNKAFIGMGAVVSKDIPADETWLGSPIRSVTEFKRMQSKLNKLLQDD